MVPVGKSPARGGVAPPLMIELPTTHIVLSRTPASINIDADDDEEEAINSKDSRLITPCVVVSSIMCDSGLPSPSSSSSAATLTAVCGYYWFSCPQGLLEAANAIAASASAKRSTGDLVVSSASHGFDTLPSDACSPLSSLHEVVESLLSDSGASSKNVSGGRPMPTTPNIFLALSTSSFRVYAMVTADGTSAADAPRDDEEKSNSTAETPSIPRTRGGAKERMTSAVAFDFVSGIMKSVVGDNVDSLFATDSTFKEEE